MATTFLSQKSKNFRIRALCTFHVSQQIILQKGDSISNRCANVSNSGTSRRGVSEFSARGDVLGVRQSAVSRRVRELEDELGVSLFERHHAGVRVTNAGARFLQEARTALVQLDHAVKTAAAAGSGTVGRLSVGILSSIATGYL